MKECPACNRCFPDGVNHCPEDGDGLRFLFAGEPLLDGRYRLERKIGAGGMGMVFKARHVFLKTTHAVKVILPDLVGNDPTLTTRFRQEAMAAAAIRHPHTVSVTDYGVLGGTTPYLVMEYVEGRSLHDLLTRQGKLPAPLAVEIALAVCEGVAAAHRAGIVHRDLKPLNILLREGEAPRDGVKVLDFGLAKIKSGELLGSFVAAQTQGLMGSPFYMAPEQWGDEDVDVRADIYSLGVILYQMLAGDVPFGGRSIPSIMNKHLTTAPVPLAERGAEVPPEVERVVRRALEKDPARRQQTVAELMGELRAALAALGGAGLPAAAGGQTLPPRPDEDSIKTAAGGLNHTAAEGEQRGMQTVAGPYASGPQVSGPPAGPAPIEPPGSSSPPPSAQPPSSAAPPMAPPVSPAGAPPAAEPGRERGGVTTGPQAGHTAPVGRSDERARPAPVTRPGTEALTEPLPPSSDSFGRVSGGPARGDQAQDLAGLGAQRLADEAARRARETAQGQAQPASWPPGGHGVAGAAGAGVGVAGAHAGAAPQVADASSGAAEPGRRTSRAPLVAAGAAAVLLSLGGAAYFLSRTTPEPTPEPQRSEEPSRPPAAADAPPAAEAPPAAAALVALPGGAFRAGRDDVPPMTEQARRARPLYLLWMYQQWPAHPVTVGPFAMDRTEVTNEEYAQFVAEAGRAAPSDSWEGGRPPDYESKLPVTNVSYEDAVAFAAWRSKRDGVTYRLPTEDEWEYAARGGGPSRLFPWGEEWGEGRANLNGSGPAPVGSFVLGDTPQGLTDMIGNVWELTSSEAGMYAGNDRTELDPSERGHVVIRGGSYQSRADGDEPVTATSRRWVARDFRSPVIGFRLVRPGR